MLERLTDAHCHLSGGSPDSLPPPGVEACAACACFAGEWGDLDGISRASVKKVYGIHPDAGISALVDVGFAEEQIFSALLPELDRRLASADAVGEIGLDARIAGRVPLEMQKRVFAAQLEMARARGLPAVIHCVGGWGAMCEILRGFFSADSGAGFLIHAASCSAEVAASLEKLGAYFSFGVRELSSRRGAECAARVGADRIMMETDGGCSAASLENAAASLAAVRSASAAEIADAAFENFRSFYSK